MFPLKSEIAVIGAGRISYSLVNAVLKSGFKVSLIISKHITSAKKLAVKFKIKNYSSDLSFLSQDIKIFFLAVPDSQISLVAKKISKLRLDFKNSMFIHLSGAEDISALNNLKKKGAHIASFHIMQTFPERKIINLKGSYAAIETNDKKAESFLLKLAKKLGLRPFKINSHKKIAYHIAGVYSSNFLVANQYYIEKLFGETKSGMDYKKVFAPINETTLKNIEENGILNAISGPVVRGDIETIRKHIALLKKQKELSDRRINLNLPLLNYLTQSLTILKVLGEKQRRLTSSQLQIKKLLEEELSKVSKLH